MTIYLYSGTAGSGKSMHQAIDIYSILKGGGCVLANYNIHTEAIPHCKGDFHQYDMFELDPMQLKKFSIKYFETHRFKESSINVFIDEAQLIFNSRDWGKKNRREWLEFFTQHRKYGFDIFLVSQSDMMLDKQIRATIEYEEIHRMFSNGGHWGKLFSLLMGGKTFVCIKRWYPVKMGLGTRYFHVRSKYYSLYDSYQDFSDDVSISKPASTRTL